jgi:TrpR-related protein YerC/YecD
MGKIGPQKIDSKFITELYSAVLMLKSNKEIRMFFRDVMTEQEILEFARRWKAARMLNAKTPYTEIIGVTGLSSATIARISKWLNAGAGGYRLILKRQNEHHRFSSAGKK